MVIVIFYSLGYATVNVVCIPVERKLAFGMIILHVFSTNHGRKMTETFHKMQQTFTLFHGEGMKEPVLELYLACRMRDLKWMIPKVYEGDSDVFYVVEQAKDVSKVLKLVYRPLEGWRQRSNRK